LTNKLFFGDYLDVMRTLPEECRDLIYLDPPFRSNATYNLLLASPTGDQARAQIEAFDDTWHWGEHLAKGGIYPKSSLAPPSFVVELVEVGKLF
jgi:DNA modification methylase